MKELQNGRLSPNAYTLIGPFKQVVTFAQAGLRGPLQPDSLGIIEEGGVVVAAEGKIVDVGVFADLQVRYKAAVCAPVSGNKVLLPGFIDAHTHILFAGNRARDYSMRLEGKTYLEVAGAGGGIMHTVCATRAATNQTLSEGLLARLQIMLRGGITTAEVKTGYGLNIPEELRLLQILEDCRPLAVADIIPTCLAAHMKPPDYLGSNSAYLSEIRETLFPVLKTAQLTKRIDIFIEASAFSSAEATGYLEAARRSGFDITVHADQFTPGGATLAVAFGAISADHLEASSDTEIRLLGRSNTVATVLPGASLGLGIPFAPARKLLDAGAIVAIASDWNPGSAPMGDLLTGAALLSAYQKLSMAETLAGMTFRAAAALGLSDRGKLVPGAMADMQAYNTKDYRDILYNQGQLRPAIIWKKSKSYDQ